MRFIKNYLKSFRSNNGFTIVELLVVLSIISIMSAGLIFYSRTSERQIILFQEQAKVISALYKAKSLASSAYYSETEVPCAYGVHFEKPNKVIIFKDLSPENLTNCSDVDNKYSGSNEIYQQIILDKTVKISKLDLTDVVFVPPYIIVVIDNGDKESGLITLQTVDGLSTKIIKITDAGQITVKYE